MNSKNTAAFIKTHREIFGLTQEAFGAKVGVSKRTVAMWESGKSEPTQEILNRIMFYIASESRKLWRENEF